ncbi:MAG: response regulator [Deltaproteobacteria bacterium]|nr:MAG: response regulator [Deltaproteobacteria bacterium]
MNRAWVAAFGDGDWRAAFPDADLPDLTALESDGSYPLGVHVAAAGAATGKHYACELVPGDERHALVVARDSGELPAVENEARFDARFRELIEQFTAAIIVHRNGRFLYANPAAVAYLGYQSAQELHGLPVTSVLHPSEIPDVLKRIAYMAETGLPVADRETRLVRPDGSEMLAELGAFVLDRDTDPAFVVVARDISERKKLEEQLRHGRRMESIGRLAGGIAHDFNNHLAVILNYADFLVDALSGDPSNQRDAREIRHAAQRAASLTQQLLMFSRGDLSESEHLDVNGVVEGMLEFLRRTLGADIELVTTIGRGLPTIHAARQHIEQILVNLAVNARDATPSGGELRIETGALVVNELNQGAHPNVAPGRYVLLEVADNGRGMSAEVASRAFEPFFTTKSDGKGTGLGLSTVYGIVTHAGGDVELDSVLGRGTTVRILWPASEAGNAAKTPAEEEPTNGRESHTVLLVEDDAAVRALVARMLAREGYRVVEAIDAVEALSMVDDDQPELDLLVTDVIMPRMTGPELAVALQSSYPDLPTVFMSGYADDVLEQHDVQSAVVTFLPKPFSARELREKIEVARTRVMARRA